MIANLRPSRERHDAAAPALVATVTASALAYIAAVDPNRPGHYPLCPFRAVTGYACPGCGSLRALHALLTGHPARAVHHNVLTVALLPFLVVASARWLASTFGWWTPAPRRARAVWIWALLAVVIGFAVLRNVPPMRGGALGP